MFDIWFLILDIFSLILRIFELKRKQPRGNAVIIIIIKVWPVNLGTLLLYYKQIKKQPHGKCGCYNKNRNQIVINPSPGYTISIPIENKKSTTYLKRFGTRAQPRHVLQVLALAQEAECFLFLQFD